MSYFVSILVIVLFGVSARAQSCAGARDPILGMHGIDVSELAQSCGSIRDKCFSKRDELKDEANSSIFRQCQGYIATTPDPAVLRARLEQPDCKEALEKFEDSKKFSAACSDLNNAVSNLHYAAYKHVKEPAPYVEPDLERGGVQFYFAKFECGLKWREEAHRRGKTWARLAAVQAQAFDAIEKNSDLKKFRRAAQEVKTSSEKEQFCETYFPVPDVDSQG